MKHTGLLVSVIALLCLICPAFGELPEEPVEIGHEPQFFVDDWIVDNRWAFRTAAHHDQALVRQFHPPEKHPDNPVIQDPPSELLRKPGSGAVALAGHFTISYDDEADHFRAWYKVYNPNWRNDPGPKYGMAYAQSEDGLNWKRPSLGLFEWRGSKENNICWTEEMGSGTDGTVLTDLPERARRGHRYVMLFQDRNGINLVGSDDGIHWDESSKMQIAAGARPDTMNDIVYDPRRDTFVLFTRSTALYTGSPHTLGGASRRVARFEHDTLWEIWPILPNRGKEQRTAPPDANRTSLEKRAPQLILIPDAIDAETRFNFFYGMPTRYHAGIYWGFLWLFKHNTEIYTELVVGRDGESFQRLPGNPRLLEPGEEGSWDRGLVRASAWAEVGDEWWIYYDGWDGPHGEAREARRGIGVATVRKEGLVSLRGPEDGGIVVTRTIRWPGGDLHVNADTRGGEMTVRVSDHRRRVIPGFDFDDSKTFTGDSVEHRVTWKDREIDELTGQIIRLEFQLHRTDLYTFRAAER